MKKLVEINILHGVKSTIQIPIEIHGEKLTRIGFGTRTVTCKFTKEKPISNNSIVYISQDLVGSLNLPLNRPIHCFVNEEILHFGPLIGIFTAGFTESFLRPIGERSLFFAKILAMEKIVGVCAYVFGAHLINWDEGTVMGYFYDEKKGWTQHEVPLPNVIYDRLPNRKTENHDVLKKVKHRLQKEYLIPWYNPGFFNKWDIYQLLKCDPSLSQYLPETIHQPTYQDIEDMLEKYKSVYIKPANGSLGFGIYQIVASETEKIYYCRYKDGQENRLQKFSSLRKLVLYAFKNINLDTYLIQQGIRLIRFENLPVDFRIHTNRDQNGEWKMTAIAAKVAGSGSVTTHLSSGGIIKTLEELYPEEEARNELQARFIKAVLSLSKAIASKTDGYLGEIGFDIALDREGKIWLFEANSKPGRSIFIHPKLRSQDRLSRQLSMSYGIYLTEQGIRHPEVQYQ